MPRLRQESRFLRRATRAVLAVAVIGAVAGATAPSASGFKISIGSTFWFSLPIVAHAGKDTPPIHEDMTYHAIVIGSEEAGWPTPDRDLSELVWRGAQNADITHQWDPAQHFDNATIANDGFTAGFNLIKKYLKSARENAKDNEQFDKPEFGSFKKISDEVKETFFDLVGDQECVGSARCPSTRFLFRWRKIEHFDDILWFNPNPDPHGPSNPGSLFASPREGRCSAPRLCQAIGGLAKDSRELVAYIEEQVEWALGEHGGRTLEQILGKKHRLVLRLKKARDKLRAYQAFQDLGHAFHATQDFFAHSNYVELMAGVPVGTSIAEKTSFKPEDIPVPDSWDKFSLDGLRQLMSEHYAQLESGAVYTTWLGEEDFCMGALSLFNPDKPIVLTVPSRLPQIGGKKVTLAAAGANPNPPPGLHYCHYQTTTTAGLNKDEPTPDEPSHANHEYAKSAALRVSKLLCAPSVTPSSPVRPPKGSGRQGRSQGPSRRSRAGSGDLPRWCPPARTTVARSVARSLAPPSSGRSPSRRSRPAPPRRGRRRRLGRRRRRRAAAWRRASRRRPRRRGRSSRSASSTPRTWGP